MKEFELFVVLFRLLFNFFGNGKFADVLKYIV